MSESPGICSVPVQFECYRFCLIKNSHHIDGCNAKMHILPLFLHLMYTYAQTTPTTADIASADTAQTAPYTV